jgi:PKD repeat protein
MNIKSNTISSIFIAFLLILLSITSFAISVKEVNVDQSRDYTHTVLAEEPTATWCGYCPTVATYMDNIWDSYEYDWNFISLVNDKNTYAAQRNDELNIEGFPSVYYDGGYEFIVGSGSPQSTHEATIDLCGARTVADIDINLTAIWTGDNELDITVEVTNNEASTYDGMVRVYVTENHSRWYVGGVQYRFAFIGNYAINEDVLIGPGGNWNQNVIWDGDDWGFTDLTSDNLRVIVGVFDEATGYVDESKGMEPLTNIIPIADFSYTPEYPGASEVISFADGSFDPDGSIVEWNWDFDDGNSSTVQNPTHTYNEEGFYTVSLTVTDDDGATDIISNQIIVKNDDIIVVQTINERGFPIRHAVDGDWAAAQNFLPNDGVIIKNIDVMVRRFGSPEFNLTAELREDSPEGTLIDSLIFTPDEVPNGWFWFTLDFSDVTVISGTEYFIVIPPAPEGVSTSFGYEWAYAFGNQYDDGSFWFTRDGGDLWRDLPNQYEFAFGVFGTNP